MTDKSELVTAVDLAQAHALAMDVREGAVAVRDTQPGDSVLGLSHTLCEHHVAAATCPLCLYGERGTKAVADMGALRYGERVALRVAEGESVDPVVVAEQGYRAGFVAGKTDEKDAATAQGVLAARGGSGEAKDAMRVLLALDQGQITKTEALHGMLRWAHEIRLAIGYEEARALPGGEA